MKRAHRFRPETFSLQSWALPMLGVENDVNFSHNRLSLWVSIAGTDLSHRETVDSLGRLRSSHRIRPIGYFPPYRISTLASDSCWAARVEQSAAPAKPLSCKTVVTPRALATAFQQAPSYQFGLKLIPSEHDDCLWRRGN